MADRSQQPSSTQQGKLFAEESDFALPDETTQGDQGTLFTIGHSTRKLEELIAALKHYRIERLVDIRHYPSSRHNPQFNQPALRDALAEQEIHYVWLKELGGYREGGYLAYMETDSFATGLEKLRTLARERPTACMCAEVKWYQCHRRRVADAFADRGWQVVHIIDESRAEMHHAKTNRIKCD